VLGRDFTYALLAAVDGVDDPTLQSALDRLASADLLIVEGAGHEANYRFKHALIQDAAYDSLLKIRRQSLHRRAAEVLRDDPERAAAEPEVIAHHFTQAGFDDLAIEWWGKAGDQALRRSAFQEAIAHLGKAIAMSDKAGAASRPGAADAASSSQRLKLQTDYGQALMWSKGFTSKETTAAFGRARKMADGVDEAIDRFSVRYGAWIGGLAAGELRSAREISETFLREAENEGRMSEAAVAARYLGTTCLFQGDLIKAQAYLERALSIYDPERDREVRYRFGVDGVASATAHLAQTSWLLGDPVRARRLMEQAVACAIETGHVPDKASVYYLKSVFELVCGDAEAARSAAELLGQLGRDHPVPYAKSALLLSSAARSRLGEANLAELRQILAQRPTRRILLNVPLLKGLLAESQSQASNLEEALAEIDAALALASETGERWTDALLQRVRGAILLKRDPASAAPAEEAFQTAIAVAKEQGARSYELLASLSLAKLYQSTGRNVEARAVLAPVLEGFSQTPEMPEIAEAQALLEHLP